MVYMSLVLSIFFHYLLSRRHSPDRQATKSLIRSSSFARGACISTVSRTTSITGHLTYRLHAPGMYLGLQDSSWPMKTGPQRLRATRQSPHYLRGKWMLESLSPPMCSQFRQSRPYYCRGRVVADLSTC